jgi:hypothetical protein
MAILLGELASSHRSLPLKIDKVSKHDFIEDTDMERLESLRKIVSDGGYAVPAEELAAKLVDYMFQLSNSHLEMGAADGLEITPCSEVRASKTP